MAATESPAMSSVLGRGCDGVQKEPCFLLIYPCGVVNCFSHRVC